MRPTRQSNQHLEQNPKTLPSGSNNIERGVILLVDGQRHSYRVALNSGRSVFCNRLKSHPGDHILLPIGTKVVVSWALGSPYIIGVLPEETQLPPNNAENAENVTDTVGHGGQDPTLNRNLGVSGRAAGDPNDLMPGDQVLASKDGASIAALHGRVAQLKGSPLAKIIALGNEDLVQIVAGVMRVLTWMGESKVINENGKTSFIFRGGSDQLTQTGPDEERYTIKFDLGHTGGVLLFELTNSAGQAVFRLHINDSGHCDIFAAGGIVKHIGDAETAQNIENHQGNILQQIDGNKELIISGTNTERVTGNYSQECNNFTKMASGNEVITVLKSSQKNIGESAKETIVNNYEQFVKGFRKVEVDTTNTLKALQANIFSNDIVLGEGATSHGVKYEELLVELNKVQESLNLLLGLYNSHTHAESGSTTSTTTAIATFRSEGQFENVKANAVRLK